MTRAPSDRVNSLRAHCVKIFTRACRRVVQNACAAEREVISRACGGDVDGFGSVDDCARVVDAMFTMCASRCGRDVDASCVMRDVRESAEAMARNLEAERERCFDVFAEAARADAETLRATIERAMKRGVMDRERAKWRREVIVERHRALRRAARGVGGGGAWMEATATETARDDMKTYAEAATEVGNRAWVLSSLEWCVDAIGSYFGDGSNAIRAREVAFSWTLANARRAKALARRAPESSVPDALARVNVEMPDQSEVGKAITLLDVGSCWDYFGLHYRRPWPGGLKVMTRACDLCPSVPSVLECDWLGVEFGDRERVEEGQGESKRLIAIQEHGVDALVFSLVLSYVPTPRQRGEMVRRARLALKNRGAGLLFIITPHSTDKGHCPQKALPILKEWREALDSLGFERVLYERQRSTHCLAFRTIGDGDEARSAEPPEMRIAFDAQD